MSTYSRAKDLATHPERTEEAQEACAARHRIKAVDAEQAMPAMPFDVGSLQHVANVFRLCGCFPDGTKKPTTHSRRLQRQAFQAHRKASAVRRQALPVVANAEGVYLRLSNGQRIRHHIAHSDPFLNKIVIDWTKREAA